MSSAPTSNEASSSETPKKDNKDSKKGDGNKRNDKKNDSKAFKGELTDMNGRTFCLQSEKPAYSFGESMKPLRTVVFMDSPKL